MKRITYFFHFLLLILLVFLDQLTKWLARTRLPGNPKSVWEGVFTLYYHENRGSVWGILQGKVNFLLIVSLILFACILYLYWRTPKKAHYQSLLWLIVVMAAGALGNTIDRIAFGYVTDFLYFELINFPIFNVADCYITISAFMAVALAFTKYKEDDFAFLSPVRKGEKRNDTDTERHEN